MVSIPGLGGSDGNLATAAADIKKLQAQLDKLIPLAKKKVQISYDEALAELERRNVDKATVARVKEQIERVRTRAIADAQNFGLRLKEELERQRQVALRTAG